MYTFIINETAQKMSTSINRALLFLAAFACFITIPLFSTFLNSTLGILLIIAAFTFQIAQAKYRNWNIIIMTIGACFLFIVTNSFFIALLFFGSSKIVKMMYKIPSIVFTENNICVKKTGSIKTYQWAACNNIIYKDGLLTIDFKNNHLLQLPVNIAAIEFEATSFNEFCSKKLHTF
jgi:hypothetical protein